MDIKSRLSEYKWIKENINHLEDNLLEIEAKLQKTTSNIKEDVVQTSLDNDKWTQLIHNKIELQNRLRLEVIKSYNKINNIEKLIVDLGEREKLLIRLRYIECLEWEQICVDMHYSWRQTHYIHSDALKKLHIIALEKGL